MDMQAMDSMKSKMMELCKKMGCSEDTMKAIESDISSGKPTDTSVTVVAVKKNNTNGEVNYNISDEEIDKLDEKGAKDMLKKWRDSESGEPDESTTTKPSIADRIMNAKSM